LNAASKKKHLIRRNFALFLGSSTLIICLILVLTAGPKTWKAVQEMRLEYIFWALVLAGLMVLFDVLRLQVLAGAMGAELPFRFALKTILAYNFMSYITPTLTGGEPLIIYMLRERGLGVGKSTSVVVIRGLLMIMVVAVAGPLVIYYHREIIPGEWLRRLFDITAVGFLLMVAFLLVAIFSPLRTEHLIERLAGLLERVGLLRGRTPQLVRSIDGWIDEWNYSMRLFVSQHKSSIFWAALCTLGFVCANYSIAYVVLKGLNYEVSLGKVFMVQFVLYFLLYFSPTPGGSGVAEGGFYLMFASLVEKQILGLLVVLWRFFTVYLALFLGGVVIFKTFGIDQLDMWAKEKVRPVLDSSGEESVENRQQ